MVQEFIPGRENHMCEGDGIESEHEKDKQASGCSEHGIKRMLRSEAERFTQVTFYRPTGATEQILAFILGTLGHQGKM